mmetsp:Transcript_23299/g.48459  ORF Transcript_23299/g.48459 Transcript_23299/m.48459 type:complete len:117 (+) Transcript_23299:39-389(+)
MNMPPTSFPPTPINHTLHYATTTHIAKAYFPTPSSLSSYLQKPTNSKINSTTSSSSSPPHSFRSHFPAIAKYVNHNDRILHLLSLLLKNRLILQPNNNNNNNNNNNQYTQGQSEER